MRETIQTRKKQKNVKFVCYKCHEPNVMERNFINKEPSWMKIKERNTSVRCHILSDTLGIRDKIPVLVFSPRKMQQH